MLDGMLQTHIARLLILLFIGASCRRTTSSSGSVTLTYILLMWIMYHVSSIWINDLLASLMDPELKRQVDEQYSEMELYQQGGISYFKITVDTAFKMSSMTEESLKYFIKEFGKNGLDKVPNENVCLITF